MVVEEAAVGGTRQLEGHYSIEQCFMMYGCVLEQQLVCECRWGGSVGRAEVVGSGMGSA